MSHFLCKRKFRVAIVLSCFILVCGANSTYVLAAEEVNTQENNEEPELTTPKQTEPEVTAPEQTIPEQTLPTINDKTTMSMAPQVMLAAATVPTQSTPDAATGLNESTEDYSIPEGSAYIEGDATEKEYSNTDSANAIQNALSDAIKYATNSTTENNQATIIVNNGTYIGGLQLNNSEESTLGQILKQMVADKAIELATGKDKPTEEEKEAVTEENKNAKMEEAQKAIETAVSGITIRIVAKDALGENKEILLNSSGNANMEGAINIDGLNVVLAGIYLSTNGTIGISNAEKFEYYGTTKDDVVDINLNNISKSIVVDGGEGNDKIDVKVVQSPNITLNITAEMIDSLGNDAKTAYDTLSNLITAGTNLTSADATSVKDSLWTIISDALSTPASWNSGIETRMNISGGKGNDDISVELRNATDLACTYAKTSEGTATGSLIDLKLDFSKVLLELYGNEGNDRLDVSGGMEMNLKAQILNTIFENIGNLISSNFNTLKIGEASSIIMSGGSGDDILTADTTGGFSAYYRGVDWKIDGGEGFDRLHLTGKLDTADDNLTMSTVNGSSVINAKTRADLNFLSGTPLAFEIGKTKDMVVQTDGVEAFTDELENKKSKDVTITPVFDETAFATPASYMNYVLTAESKKDSEDSDAYSYVDFELSNTITENARNLLFNNIIIKLADNTKKLIINNLKADGFNIILSAGQIQVLGNIIGKNILMSGENQPAWNVREDIVTDDLNQNNDLSFSFTVDSPKTNVSITVDEDAKVTASQTIDMVVVSEQVGFYLQADILGNTDLLEKLNFFTYKDGNATIDIKGILIADGPIHAVSKVIIVSDTSNNALKALIPIGVCAAVSDSHVSVSGDAKINSNSSILIHASNYINLNSQARGGAAPIAVAFCLALPDTYVNVDENAKLIAKGNIYLLADAVVRTVAVATGAPVNELETKNKSGGYLAVIVVDQDTDVKITGNAYLDANGDIELISNSAANVNSASISVPSDEKQVKAKQLIGFAEKVIGVKKSNNQSLFGKIASTITGSNSIGNLFTKGTAGAEDNKSETTEKKSETQFVGAFAVSYLSNTNKAIINTTNSVKAGERLLLQAFATTISYAKADGSLYKNPTLIPGYNVAGKPKNALGIGIVVVYYDHDNVAKIEDGSITAYGLTVKAQTGRSISSAISKAGHVPSDTAGVGLGGAITVHIVHDNTVATLGKEATYTLGSHDINVLATADHAYVTVADASGKRETKTINLPIIGFKLPITQAMYDKNGTGVGSGIAVFVGGGDVTANIEDGVIFTTVSGVNADNVKVYADRKTKETVIAEAGAGGGKAVAPVIATVISGYSAESYLGLGTTTQDYYNGNAEVTAGNQVIRKIKADAAAVGVSAGMGGSFVVAVINDSSNASLKRNVNAVNIHVLAKGISRFTADSNASAAGANPATVTGKSAEQASGSSAVSGVVTEIKELVTGSGKPGDNENVKAPTPEESESKKGDADQVADKNINCAKELSKKVESKNVKPEKIEKLTENRPQAQTSEGNVQVAAAFVVNVMQHVVEALIGDDLTLTARKIANNNESGIFKVEAINDTDSVIKANASATKSQTGVGVGAAVNVVTFTNKAILGNSRVVADQIVISADTLEAAEAESLDAILADLVSFLAEQTEGQNLLLNVLNEQLGEGGLQALIDSELAKQGSSNVTKDGKEVKDILVSEIVSRLTGKKAVETASDLVKAVVESLLKEVMDSFLKPENLITMIFTGNNPALDNIMAKAGYMAKATMVKMQKAMNTYLRMKFGSNDEMDGVGHKISTTAISGAGAANIGIAGAVAVTVINGTTEAIIIERAEQNQASDIVATGDVILNARHVQKVYTTATAAADKKGAADKNKNATSSSTGDSTKSVGVGAAAATTIINATVDAGVGKNRTVTAGTMSILAKIYDDVETISVAGSDPIARKQKAEEYVQTVGAPPKEVVAEANTTGTKDISVDASAAVGLINNEVNAYVKEGTKVTTTGADTIKLSDTEFVNFYLHSEQHGETLASASAFAVGGAAAVGACAAVNLPASDVTTTLAGNVVAAGNAKVDSYTFDADESHAYATVVGASLDRYLDKLRDMLQLASLNAGQSTNALNAKLVNKINGVINTAKTTAVSKVSGFLPASVSALISQKVSTGEAPDTTSKTTTAGGANAKGQNMDSSAKEEQSINIAAAVAVNVTKHKAITIMSGSLIAMAIQILAENHGNFRTLGTGATVTGTSDTNANNISLGVAVSSNKNEADTTVAGTLIATGVAGTTKDTTARNGDITLDATLTQNMDGNYKGLLAAQALAGSISADGGKVGFSGAVAVLVGSAVTSVKIADGSIIEGKNLVFNATDKSKYAVRAGSATVSKGAKAGIGASYAMIYANNKTIVMVGEKESKENSIQGVTITADTLSIKAEKQRVDGSDYSFPLDKSILFTVDATSTDKGLINLTTTDGASGKYSIDIGLSSDDFLLVFDMLNYLASVNYYTEAIAGSIIAGQDAKLALAGAMALVYLQNETRAELGDKVKITLSGDMKQEALEDTVTRMITGSLSASSAKVGVGASISALSNTDKISTITGKDNQITTNGDISVLARNIANVLSITVACAATGGGTSAATVGGAINVIDSKNIINAIVDENNTINGKNITVKADNCSDYMLFNTAATGAGKGVAVGGTVAVILMNNNTLSSILKGTTITSVGNTEMNAVSNEKLFNILASISGAAQGAAVAGTLGVVITESKTEASLGDNVSVTAGKDIKVAATGNVKQFMVLASAAVSGSSAAVGATITVDVMQHTVKATTGEGCVLIAGGNVLVTSDGTDHIFLITAAGTASGGSAAISGAIPVVVSDSFVEAVIGQANTVKATDSVGVFATLDSDFYNIAGSVAATGGNAGVGATIQTLVMENNVEAKVMDFSSITALTNVTGENSGVKPNRAEKRKGLSVYANLNSNLLLVGVSGAAAGTAGVAGVVDTVVINNTTLARISNHVACNAREHRDPSSKHITSSSKNDDEAGADASVYVEAYDNTRLYHIAGALSVGATAGVGATVAVTIFNNIVKAQIGEGCHIYANGDINVKASSVTELSIIIVTFGVGGTTGVAGAVSVALFDNEVEASIGQNSLLDSNGKITVNATSNNKIISVGAAASASGTAAVGAVCPVIKFTGLTIASVGNTTKLTAKKDVLIQADSTEDIYAFAAGGAGSGTASVAGTFETVLTEVITKAYTRNDVIITGNNITIQAVDSFDLVGAAGTVAGAGLAGVGLSVLVTISHNTISAITGSNNKLTADHDIIIKATDNRDVSIYAITAGGGGAAGVSGTVVVTIVGSKLNEDSYNNINNSSIKPQDNVNSAFATCNNEKANAYKDKANVDALSEKSTNKSDDGAVNGNEFKLAEENEKTNSNADNGEERYTVNDGQIDTEANKEYPRPESVKKDVISATVGNGSNLTAGKDIVIDATDHISLDMFTGTIAVGGYAGVGIGVTVGILYSNVIANTDDNVIMSAAGDIKITATGDAIEKSNANAPGTKVENASDKYSVRVITVGGSGSAVGVTASVASLDIYTVTKAYLGLHNTVKEGNTLIVKANSNYGEIVVWNLAASGGAVGINATITRGNYDAIVSAYISADSSIENVAGTTKVEINSNTTLNVIGASAAVGGAAGNATVILAFYTTNMEAFIGQGTSMINCGALVMGANANVTAKAKQASLTAGSYAAGVSVVIVKLTPVILTYVGKTPVGFIENTAATSNNSGTLSVSSLNMKNFIISKADIDSTSVAGGMVSGNGLVAIAINRTNSYAGISKTNVASLGNINITALMDASSDVDAIAAQFGTSAAFGAIAAYSELKTLNKAGMDLTEVTVSAAKVDIQAGDVNNVSVADTNVISGALAGSAAITINVAFANNAYENVALIDGNNGSLTTTGDITIQTLGRAKSTTKIKGVGIALVSVGVSLGMTYLKAISKAGIEGCNNIYGGNIKITSNLNKDATDTVTSYVLSGMGGLVGINGAVAVAASRGINIATASGNILATGDLDVIANGNVSAKAETLEITAGFIAVGLMFTSALAEGTYLARIDNTSTTKIQATNFNVINNTNVEAYSVTQAANGGVSVSYASASVNVAYAKATSKAEAMITGNGNLIIATNNATVQTNSHAKSVADAKGSKADPSINVSIYKMAATTAIASLTTNMSSYVENQTDMIVKGTLQILTLLNNEYTNSTITNRENGAYAVAGSNGAANVSAIGGEVSTATALQSAIAKSYITMSNLDVTGSVDIKTLSNVLSYADIETNNFGVIGGVGAINTYAQSTGNYQAYIDATNSSIKTGALTILTQLNKNNTVATTKYLTGGVISVSVLNAIATNKSTTEAFIKGTDGTLNVKSNACIKAVSENNYSNATVKGITGASGIKVGNALTKVYLNSTVKAYMLGSNTFTGTEALIIEAQNIGNANAYSNNSTGITLIGASGAESFIENKMITSAILEGKNITVDGDVNVLANGNATIKLSNIKSGSEILGVGVMYIETDVKNQLSAGINSNTSVNAKGNITVSAKGISTQQLSSEATSGGLLNGSSLIEKANSNCTVNAYAGDGAVVNALNDLMISGDNTICVQVYTKDASVGGIKLGAYIVTTNTSSNVDTTIGKNTVLNAGNNIYISALDFIKVINETILFSAGLVGTTASATSNTATQNVKVTIKDSANIKAINSIEIAANTDHMMKITCKSSAHGLASVSASYVINKLTRTCKVQINDYVIITSDSGDITIAAYSVPSAVNQEADFDGYAMRAEATGTSAGLFEVSGAKAENILDSDTNITIGKGGRIETTYANLIIAAQTGSSAYVYAYRDAAQAITKNTTEAILSIKNPVSVIIKGTIADKANVIGKNVKITAINSLQKLKANAYSYMRAAGAVTKAMVTVTVNADQKVDIQGGNIRGYDSVTINAMASNIQHDFITHSEIFGAVGVVYATTEVTGQMKATVFTDDNTEIASKNVDIQAFAPTLSKINHVVKAEAIANTILAWVFKIVGYVVKWVMKAVGWVVGLFSKKKKQKIEEAVYDWVEEIQSSTAYPTKTDHLKADSELNLNGKVSIGGAAAGIVVDIYEDGTVNAIGIEDSEWLSKVITDHNNKTVTLPYIYNATSGSLSLDAGEGMLYGNLKVYLNNYLPYITFRNHSDYQLILSDITVFNTDVNPIDIAVTARNYRQNLNIQYGDETPIISVIADKASDVILNGEINNVKGQLNIKLNGGNIYVGAGGIQDQSELLRGDTEFLTKMFVGTNIWVNTLIISGAQNIGNSKDNRLQIGLIRYSGYNSTTKISEPAKDAEVDVVATGDIFAGFALLEVMITDETLDKATLNNLAAVKNLYLKRIKAGGTVDICLPAAKRLYVYKDGTNYEGMEISYPEDYSDTYLFIPSATLFANGDSYIIKDTNGNASKYIMTKDGLFTLRENLDVNADIFKSIDRSGIKVGNIVTELYVYNLPDETTIYTTAKGEVVMILSGTGINKQTLNIKDITFTEKNGIITLTLNDSNKTEAGSDSYITIENGVPVMHIGKDGTTILLAQTDGSWLLPNGIKVHTMFALIDKNNNQLVSTTYLGTYGENRRYLIGNLLNTNETNQYYVFDIKTVDGKSQFVEAYLYDKNQIATDTRGELFRDQTIDEAILAADIQTKLNAISLLSTTTASTLAQDISALVTKGIQVEVKLTQQRRIIQEDIPNQTGQYRYRADYQVILAVILKDTASNVISSEYSKVFSFGAIPFFEDTLSALNSGSLTESKDGNGTVYEEQLDKLPGREKDSNGNITDNGIEVSVTGTLDKTINNTSIDAARNIASTEIGKLSTLTKGNEDAELNSIISNITAKVGSNITVKVVMPAPTETESTETTPKKYTYTITFTITNGSETRTVTKTIETEIENAYSTVTETTGSTGTLKEVTSLDTANNVATTKLDEVTELSANILNSIATDIQSNVSKEIGYRVNYRKVNFDNSTLKYQYELSIVINDGTSKKTLTKNLYVLAKQSELNRDISNLVNSVINDISINNVSPYSTNSSKLAETLQQEIATKVYGNVHITVVLEQNEAIQQYDDAVQDSVNAYTYSYSLKVKLTDILDNAIPELTVSRDFTNAKWLLGKKPYVVVSDEVPGWSNNLHSEDQTSYSKNGTAAGIAYGYGYEITVGTYSSILVREDIDKTSGYVLRYGANEYEIEKLEASDLKSDGTATYHLTTKSYTGQTEAIYNYLKNYLWAIKGNALTMYSLSDLQIAKNKIYEKVAGDIAFTNGANLVINRIIAEYPGTVTSSGNTEYVYVSMIPSSQENAKEERTLQNSVVYISALNNQMSRENPFKGYTNNPYGDKILIFEKLSSRDIYAPVTDDTNVSGIIIISNGDSKYYKVGYISYKADGTEEYHIYINQNGTLVDTIFDPYMKNLVKPKELDSDATDDAKNKYKEEKNKYDANAEKIASYSRLLFGDKNIAVGNYDRNSNIIFDVSKGEGIVLNPNGSAYYQSGNKDFEIPLIDSTFRLSETEQVRIEKIDGTVNIYYEYLMKDEDGKDKVYASYHLDKNIMKWYTKNGNMTFSTKNFASGKVTLSAGYELQGSKVSDNVVTILNGSEFFYTNMELNQNQTGTYTIKEIIYADLSTKPERQIWLVQTKDGMITEIKEVYSETATTLTALVADSTAKSKTRVVTFKKADLVGGDIKQAISIRDNQYNPVMISYMTDMGSYYIFPNGYTIGVLKDGTSVFFVSEIVIERFRNTQEVSGSEYQIGDVEAKQVVMTFEDENAVIVDKKQGSQAVKAEQITMITNTKTPIGTETDPFRIDVTSPNGQFRICDSNGVFDGTAYVKEITGDLLLGSITLGANAFIGMVSTGNILNSVMGNTKSNIKITKGGKIELSAGEGKDIGSSVNPFNISGVADGNSIMIKNAQNVYLNGLNTADSVLDVQITKTDYDGVISVVNAGNIKISVVSGLIAGLTAVSTVGSIEVNAIGNVNMGNITANRGSIAIASTEGNINPIDDTVLISGHNITLSALKGAIGTTTKLRSDVTVINGKNGTFGAYADGDINVSEINGSLVINGLESANGDIDLQVNGDIEPAQDNTAISGKNLNITATGNVGTKNKPVIINMSGIISIEAGRDLAIKQTNTITTDKLHAGGNLTVVTDGDICIADSVSTNSYHELLTLQLELEQKKAEQAAAEQKAEIAQAYADSLPEKINTTNSQITEATTAHDEWQQTLNDEKAKCLAAQKKLDDDELDPLPQGTVKLTEAEKEALKKEIAVCNANITNCNEKIKKYDDLLTDLQSVLAQFTLDNTVEQGETLTKAQLTANQLLAKADALKTAYETLTTQVDGLKQSVAAQIAILSAGGNMSLNAGGNVGKDDNYLSILASSGQLEVVADSIFIGSNGDLNTGNISADADNGVIKIAALGNVKPVSVTSSITADSGIIIAAGDIGTTGSKLNTNFNKIDVIGENISIQNNKDTTIGIISAKESANITVIGELTASSGESVPDIMAKKLTLYVNDDIGSNGKQIVIHTPQIESIYAGKDMNAKLTVKDVTSGDIDAGNSVNLAADGNLTVKKNSEISAPQVTIDAGGSIKAQDGGKLKINANDESKIKLSSKINEISVVTIGTYEPPKPDPIPVVVVVPILDSQDKISIEELSKESVTEIMKPVNMEGITIESWADVAAVMQTLEQNTSAGMEADMGSGKRIPMLRLNIQNSEKQISKEVLESFIGTNKALHLHLGNGIAVTLLGTAISKDCKVMDFTCSYVDIKTATGAERRIIFKNKGPLGATVLFHTFLPGAKLGRKVKIYKVNPDGSRTLIMSTVVSKNGSVCFAADSTEDYVIAF